MDGEIIISTCDQSELWNSLCHESGVPAHCWSFNNALRASGIAPKLAAIKCADGRLTIPFFERQWHGYVDVCTVLSASGASCVGPPQPLIAQWNAHAQRNGWVASYLQFEPTSNLGDLDDAAEGQHVFLLDISKSDLIDKVSPIIRRKIRAAIRENVELVEDRAALLEPLGRLYGEMLARNAARPFYRRSNETIHQWLLADDNLTIGAAVGGKVVSVAMFLMCGRRAEFHIGASSEAARGLSAWLLWNGIEKLRAMGVRTLNLGGGVRRGDGLQQFKAKFGGDEKPLHVVRIIHKPEVYRCLCHRSGTGSKETWFPAYRAAESRSC